MKGVGAALALVGLTSAFFLYYHAQQDYHAQQAVAAPPLPTSQSPLARDCLQCAALGAQISDLQRNLTDIKAQLASQRGQLATEHDRLGEPAKQLQPDSRVDDVEAGRAVEAERRKEYLAGIAEGFGKERVDDIWAGRASSRISAALDTDDVLRGVARKVECRWQTCRVELDDDGSGKVSTRMPFVVMGLADVLPGMNAEQVTRGDGRLATVLYMSNAQPAN